jgi:hypothetical protein
MQRHAPGCRVAAASARRNVAVSRALPLALNLFRNHLEDIDIWPAVTWIGAKWRVSWFDARQGGNDESEACHRG